MKMLGLNKLSFLIIIFIFLFQGFDTYACTGGTDSGNFSNATSDWQTVSGIEGGDYYNLYCYAGEVYIFSFCQGGASYSDDPLL